MFIECSISRLHDVFRLDSDGRLFWKKRTGPCCSLEKEAGRINNGEYRQIQLDRKLYQAHRIVFAMTYGRWPVLGLDHINRNKTDNRPGNLREATGSQNLQNQGITSRNASGIKGVCWATKQKRWMAYIRINKKIKHLGLYLHDELELAELVVAEARRKYHGEFARLA
jgi:hypothetical protein